MASAIFSLFWGEGVQLKWVSECWCMTSFIQYYQGLYRTSISSGLKLNFFTKFHFSVEIFFFKLNLSSGSHTKQTTTAKQKSKGVICDLWSCYRSANSFYSSVNLGQSYCTALVFLRKKKNYFKKHSFKPLNQPSVANDEGTLCSSSKTRIKNDIDDVNK